MNIWRVNYFISAPNFHLSPLVWRKKKSGKEEAEKTTLFTPLIFFRLSSTLMSRVLGPSPSENISPLFFFFPLQA
jgi:hypothetical protein